MAELFLGNWSSGIKKANELLPRAQNKRNEHTLADCQINRIFAQNFTI